jgi:hypothetical protein
MRVVGPPETILEVLELAARRYRQPVTRHTWPWPLGGAHEVVTLRPRFSVTMHATELYHFEVLRLRLGQSRSAAVREALALATVRMSDRADRLRVSGLRRLEALSEDDPLIERYLAARSPP